MSDEASAPAGGTDIAVITPAADTKDNLSLSQAASVLAKARQRTKEPPAVTESAPVATEQPKELAVEASADPVEEQAPGEDTPNAEPAEQPPIEPPRSWTKEAKDRWNALPREAQEEVARIEQSREREFRRSQNEAAEQRKAIEADRKAAEHARKEYEAKLPAVERTLLEIQSSQFSDIKTMADVEKMSIEDPFRKIQWDTHQQKLQAVAWEKQQADHRQKQETETNWQKHIGEENSKAAELHPELADPVKAKKLQGEAVDLLHDKGFTDQELTRLASGEDKISIYDHRLQSLLLDGVKYRDAQKAPPKAVPPNVPQVQRPGVAPPKGAAASEALQALTQKFERTGSLKDAQELRAAQARLQQRRAS